MRFTFKQWILFLIIATILIIYPSAVPSYYFTALLTQVLIFSIFTMGLNLLAGYTGLSSLGHSALFGGGAYTAALLMKYVSKNMWLGFTAGLQREIFRAGKKCIYSLLTREGIREKHQ